MASIDVEDRVDSILEVYDRDGPDATAEALRELWLRFEPTSMAGIRAEQREEQETVGIPVKVLRSIGRHVGQVARRRVDDFLPLARMLWDAYGREGRIVAVCALGKMELAEPERILPLLMELCRSCVTWEDADQMAMRAVGPVVRRDPKRWLPAMEAWLDDENKWVQRTGVTVVGRLPMKHAAYTERCLALTERLLHAEERDVRKAVSFAIRLAARGQVVPVRGFLTRHVPPQDPAATWVLCDAVRKMSRRLMPAFVPLLPRYEAWAADPELGGRERRSVESAVRALRRAKADG
jgi:3-methyladenine DNA glycosylase AlkD